MPNDLARTAPTPFAHADADDPHLWLEEVQGDAALAWVRERNALTEAQLQAEPGFEALRTRIREILDSREQIPYVVRRGAHLYNFWRDADNPRGLWRRTTLDQYRQQQPAWELLLDVDALGRAEGENWVWAGADCLAPEYRRCLISLSRGGADATVVREFDTVDKRFVDGGFHLPEAKSEAHWDDADHLLVGTDFGPGSLTDSGYPRVIKRWARGTPLAQAQTVFEGLASDVAAHALVDDTPGFVRRGFGRMLDFYNSTLALQLDGRLQPIDKPGDASLSFWRALWLFELRSDWSVGGRSWPRGALLAIDGQAYLAGSRDFTALFTPTPTRSLAGHSATRDSLLLTVLDKVATRLEAWTPLPADLNGSTTGSNTASGTASGTAADTRSGMAPGTAPTRWQHRELPAPFPGHLSVAALHDPHGVDDPLAEHFLLNYSNFLSPDALLLGRTDSDERQTLKSRPSFFDSAGMQVEQRFASSRDGTQVPYFVVRPAGARDDGDNPTLLYGYGGFEVSLPPFYSGAVGHAWLARGGVFVLANLRGGGEFGPGWHQAAIKTHKQRSYDDFIAVAEDLLRHKVTRPQRLGIQGGSNGGLLVGAVMLQRPELFGAVVCQVPLLDMRRYHRLLAGASWMAEYGDPDNAADWAAISRYSPYQNTRVGQRLPPVLLVTSTRDDRVHPGHARKMAARLLELGQPVLYWENIEGGHGGAADNSQRAQMSALEYSFLWRQLAAGR